MDQFEREEQDIIRQLEDGEITNQEYNRQMRELQRGYRDEAEQSAREAYDREMERW